MEQRIGPGRPRIGPRVDFRVPPEADLHMQSVATALDMPVDAIYRHLVCAAIGIPGDWVSVPALPALPALAGAAARPEGGTR